MPERAATCAGCGCACDDIEVTLAGDALEDVRGTCPLGDAWFAERTGAAGPAAVVDGREVDVAEAIAAAAGILSEARLPLVCGLGRSDLESQREAVALAEAIGAVIDQVAPPGDGAAGAAAQAAGLSTATFGDVRDRAEIVVAWRADPAVSHPRLLPRLRLDRAGRAAAPHAGRGRRAAHGHRGGGRRVHRAGARAGLRGAVDDARARARRPARSRARRAAAARRALLAGRAGSRRASTAP